MPAPFLLPPQNNHHPHRTPLETALICSACAERDVPADVDGGTLYFTLRHRRNTSRRRPLHLPVGASFTFHSAAFCAIL